MFSVINSDWIFYKQTVNCISISFLSFIFISFMSCSFLFASTKVCKINNAVLLSVLSAEEYRGLPTGYSYIISLNRKIDQRLLRNTFLKKYFLDNRTIDCKDKKKCVAITRTLIGHGYKDLDLGAFQINYQFHKLPLKSYFSLKKSYLFACRFISSNIRKYGYNWYAIAGYHSFTSHINYEYQKKLIASYKKIVYRGVK